MTYGDLLADLNRSPLEVCALRQAADTAGALEEIALAIAHEADLTLFDADFGDGEIAALGFEKPQINQSRPLESAMLVDQALLQKRAGGASRARLGLFTSGSTGLPKLVWQGIGNLARAVKVSPRRAEAVWALACNPTHIAGIQVYLQALANGCPLVDVHGLDRAATLVALERYGVTHLSGTPSFYRIAVEFCAVTISCLSQRFYRPTKALAALILYPVKFFDLLTPYSKEKDRIPGGYLCVARKL